jgi:hypothetical protein
MKAKIVLPVMLLSMAFISCKKERTCTCTTTSTSVDNGTVDVEDPYVSVTKYDKIKKSKLGTLCGDSKSTDSGTYNYAGDTYTYSYTTETTCELD